MGGSCAGQIACPLFDPAEVVTLYSDFVACSSYPGAGEAQNKLRTSSKWTPISRPREKAELLVVANAAARRYFHRCLLFAAGDLEALQACPSLVDASYPG